MWNKVMFCCSSDDFSQKHIGLKNPGRDETREVIKKTKTCDITAQPIGLMKPSWRVGLLEFSEWKQQNVQDGGWNEGAVWPREACTARRKWSPLTHVSQHTSLNAFRTAKAADGAGIIPLLSPPPPPPPDRPLKLYSCSRRSSAARRRVGWPGLSSPVTPGGLQTLWLPLASTWCCRNSWEGFWALLTVGGSEDLSHQEQGKTTIINEVTLPGKQNVALLVRLHFLFFLFFKPVRAACFKPHQSHTHYGARGT